MFIPQMLLPTQVREYFFLSRWSPRRITRLHSLPMKNDKKDQPEKFKLESPFDKNKNEPCSKTPCSSQAAALNKLEAQFVPEPP